MPDVERQIEKERREKDPIIFGTFQNKDTDTIIDRFYYLGDWVDEFCDLTLDKFVNEMSEATGREVAITISTPEDIEELKLQLNSIVEKAEDEMRRKIWFFKDYSISKW